MQLFLIFWREISILTIPSGMMWIICWKFGIKFKKCGVVEKNAQCQFQIFPIHFQKIRNYSKIFQISPKYSKIFQIFQNISIFSKIFQIIPKYSKIFQNIPNFSKVFRNIPKYSQTFQNIHSTDTVLSTTLRCVPPFVELCQRGCKVKSYCSGFSDLKKNLWLSTVKSYCSFWGCSES